jgi:hypothetical protein
LSAHDRLIDPYQRAWERAQNIIRSQQVRDLRAQGDLAGAKPYFERALQICRLRLGKDHALTQTVLANLEALDAAE